jgi:hypothetical protein
MLDLEKHLSSIQCYGADRLRYQSRDGADVPLKVRMMAAAK